jgi:NADPH:quinone reductase-like Zn-dependent oxidoreductase
LILNYVTAYQMLHRTAKVKAGQRALVIGASGGVGTALLQLGKLAGLTLYGLASAAKHAAVKELGATPIDYRTQDFSAEIRRLEPPGVDFVFNGIGSAYTDRSLALLKRGGKLVEFVPASGGIQLVLGLAKLALLNLWPDGKAVEFYGISALYQVDKRPFMTDLPILFRLLAEGKIKPCIAAKLPLLEAAKGNALLESGAVTGQVVLLAPELV